MLFVIYAVQDNNILTFEPVDQAQKCDCSDESYWAALFFGGMNISKFSGRSSENKSEMNFGKVPFNQTP